MRPPVAVVALSLLSVSCLSYSSIQKTDKEVYLSGAMNYWIITVPFLKRCDVEGQILRCEELKEFEPSARRNASEPTGGPPAAAGSTAPGAPAPAPAGSAQPRR